MTDFKKLEKSINKYLHTEYVLSSINDIKDVKIILMVKKDNKNVNIVEEDKEKLQICVGEEE